MGANGDLAYANIKHISDCEVITSINASRAAATHRMARNGDLLQAITGATIGKVGIVSRDSEIAFSGDLLRLRALPGTNSVYLLVAIASAAGQAQLQRWITGSTNGHRASRDAVRILIPRLGSTEQIIAETIERAMSDRIAASTAFQSAVSATEALVESQLSSTSRLALFSSVSGLQVEWTRCSYPRRLEADVQPRQIDLRRRWTLQRIE